MGGRRFCIIEIGRGYSFPDAEINFRNRKQAIYNLKNCNVLKINVEQK